MVFIVVFLASYFLMSSSIEKLDLNLLAGICTWEFNGTAICGRNWQLCLSNLMYSERPKGCCCGDGAIGTMVLGPHCCL